MKKNLYYKSVMHRHNALRIYILSFFLILSDWPRMLLEVFIRKNFGERYFRLSHAIVFAIFLILLPIGIQYLSDLLSLIFGRQIAVVSRNPYTGLPEAPSASSTFWNHYLTWYLFIAAFLVMSVRHWRVKRRTSTLFDFTKYSQYAGDIHPYFFKVQIGDKETNMRVVEIILEPLLFLLAGLLLVLLGQALGPLLIICSMFYSLGYWCAYLQGDNFVLDTIDEMICNAAMEDIFLNDKGPRETNNFRVMARKPASKANRRRLLSQIMQESEEAVDAE